MKRIFLLLLVLLPFLFLCESLDRDNILDPKNRNSNVEQVTLVELFINDSTGCDYCNYALEAIEGISRRNGYRDKVLVLEYHLALSNDPYGIAACSNRYHDYVQNQNERGIPDAFLNGKKNRIQGASAQNIENRYQIMLDNLTANKSYFRLEAEKEITNNNLNLKVKLARLGRYDMNNIVVQAIVYEDLGINNHQYVVRKILDGYSINSIQSGEVKKDINFNATLTNIENSANVFAVIFVQDQAADSREIYQAARF